MCTDNMNFISYMRYFLFLLKFNIKSMIITIYFYNAFIRIRLHYRGAWTHFNRTYVIKWIKSLYKKLLNVICIKRILLFVTKIYIKRWRDAYSLTLNCIMAFNFINSNIYTDICCLHYTLFLQWKVSMSSIWDVLYLCEKKEKNQFIIYFITILYM